MATVKVKFRASSVPGKEGTLYYHLIHQRSPCLGGDGMEGVVIHRLAVFLVGLLGHGDEAPLVRLNDTEAVDGKCAGDGNAGIGFGFVVAVHHTVDPRLDLGRRGFLLLFLLRCCHRFFLLPVT